MTFPELMEVLEELADFWEDDYLKGEQPGKPMVAALWTVIEGVQRQNGFVKQILDNLWAAHLQEDSDE